MGTWAVLGSAHGTWYREARLEPRGQEVCIIGGVGEAPRILFVEGRRGRFPGERRSCGDRASLRDGTRQCGIGDPGSMCMGQGCSVGGTLGSHGSLVSKEGGVDSELTNVSGH